jgi:hypothetical protein
MRLPNASDLRNLDSSHRQVIKYVAIGIPVVILVAAWAFISYQKPLDRHDPVAVAQKFVSSVQQDNVMTAYRLTSPKYQKVVKIQDFSDNLIPDLQKQIPLSQSELFAIATSPKDKAKKDVILNLPADETNKDYRFSILVVKDGENWAVEGIQGAPGKATKENIRIGK